MNVGVTLNMKQQEEEQSKERGDYLVHVDKNKILKNKNNKLCKMLAEKKNEL